MAAQDLYAALGVHRAASAQEIAKAYRKLALRHHPDKARPEEHATATGRFQDIARAYEVLRDEHKRQRYDQTGVYDGLEAGHSTAYDTFFDTFFGDEARASDTQSADWGYYSVQNYDRLTLEEKDLPPYMRDICKVGLHYLACAVKDLADREVAFLRHQRVDILYVMVAYQEPLTQGAFEDGYIIHYYDNPLQAGISPAWSDQNVLGGANRVSAEVRSRRVLSAEQFARRQGYAREALTVDIDAQAALEERYAPENLKEAAAAAVAAPSPQRVPAETSANERRSGGDAGDVDMPRAVPQGGSVCWPFRTVAMLAARCCEAQ